MNNLEIKLDNLIAKVDEEDDTIEEIIAKRQSGHE